MQSVEAPHISKNHAALLAVALASVALVAIALWAIQGRVDISSLRRLVDLLLRQQAKSPVAFALTYFLAYVAMAALCIPLEVPFALGAGALFGLGYGVALASFASICGATLAFLWARFLLRDRIRRYFGAQLDKINEGMARDGIFYLVNLRLLPIVPFSLCNPLMGLTTIPVGVFFIVSQLCMIFATLIFVNAGTQLFTLHSLADIMSPRLVGGLAALALLPWLGKALMVGVNAVRHRPAAAR